MTTRRRFLSALGLLAAAPFLPKQVLWAASCPASALVLRTEVKTISIRKPGSFLATFTVPRATR